jgi:hypothetical protein
MDNPKIVPFGKYKGQPLEALANDRSYLDWLTAQDWFRERYANIYTLIVNNFAEPSETPDHNALQVLFLNDVFCSKLFSLVQPHWHTYTLSELKGTVAHEHNKVMKERNNVASNVAYYQKLLKQRERSAQQTEVASYEETMAKHQSQLELFDSKLQEYHGDIE